MVCLRTCVEPRDCVLPDQAEIDEAVALVPIVVLTEEELLAAGKITVDEDDCNDLVPLRSGLSIEEESFIGTAIALLVQNADLVNWAVCKVMGWSPFSSGRDGVPMDACMSDFLDGGGGVPELNRMSVYVVKQLARQHCGIDSSGIATNNFQPDGRGPDGRRGPVIPIKLEYWRDRMLVFQLGNEADALCAALALASVMLHEAIHVCEEDTNSDCRGGSCCWEEQRMIASAFAWAMAQRYSCLTESIGCHADNDCLFANSIEGLQDLVDFISGDEEC